MLDENKPAFILKEIIECQVDKESKIELNVENGKFFS